MHLECGRGRRCGGGGGGGEGGREREGEGAGGQEDLVVVSAGNEINRESNVIEWKMTP